MTEEFVRFRGRIVPLKEARALRGPPVPSSSQRIIRVLDTEEYQNVKQLAKKLQWKPATARYWIRWLEKDSLIYNADHPKKRDCHYDLTQKGDQLAKQLKEESEEIGDILPGPKLLWMHGEQTRLFKPHVPKRIRDSLPPSDQIGLILFQQGKVPLTDLQHLVKGNKFGFEKYWLLIQKSGYVELSNNGQSETYQLSQQGTVWATTIACAYEMSENCLNCRRRILPYDRGYEPLCPVCENCQDKFGLNLSFTQPSPNINASLTQP